jgi:hypothetical protein
MATTPAAPRTMPLQSIRLAKEVICCLFGEPECIEIERHCSKITLSQRKEVDCLPCVLNDAEFQVDFVSKSK